MNTSQQIQMQFRTLLFPVYIYLLNKTTTREKIMIQDLLFFEKQLPPPARGSLGSAKRKGTLLPLKIFVCQKYPTEFVSRC